MGAGFSVSNLFNMRKLYVTYPKFQTLSGKLSWSHYCELLSIENDDERNFYEKECINSKWSVRELKRQLETSLFERLLLSDGKNNKEKVYELSKVGQTLNKPDDILKEPYVFEFLDIKENKPVLEKNLERKLIKQMEDFLLELGKGFMFIGTQQRITLGNTHYYVDIVFYNKILKCYGLMISKYELENKIRHANRLCDYFCDIFTDDHGNKKTRRVIWDISAVAYMINNEWFETMEISCPRIKNDTTFKLTKFRHKIRFVQRLDSDKIYDDLFSKLRSNI